jgi:hypothetical protein
MPRTHFVLTCSLEPVTQVAWALARLRCYNPDASVTLVVDRDGKPHYKWVADLFGANYEQLLNAPLRRLINGGKWIHTWMALSLEQGGAFERLIKLDADTMTNGPLENAPEAPYFGHEVARFGLPIRNLGVANHGAVGFSRDLVMRLVGTNAYLDPRFQDGTYRVEQYPGSKLASEEVMTAYVLREMAIPVTNWSGARHGVQTYSRSPGTGLTFMHSVCPFEREKLYRPSPWYTALLDAEVAWFRETWGSRCPAGVLP